MSPNMTSHKTSSIFTSYFWPAFMALVMAVFLSQWAVADPPEESNASVSTEMETAPPVEMEDAKDLAEDKKAKAEPDQIKTTPAVNMMSPAPSKLSEKCYEQTDGSFECVCEGEKECKALETAKHCEPGTHWGKDGYGGCTKVANK